MGFGKPKSDIRIEFLGWKIITRNFLPNLPSHPLHDPSSRGTLRNNCLNRNFQTTLSSFCLPSTLGIGSDSVGNIFLSLSLFFKPSVKQGAMEVACADWCSWLILLFLNSPVLYSWVSLVNRNGAKEEDQPKNPLGRTDQVRVYSYSGSN